MKRITLGLMAMLLSTSAVLATPVSTPLGCQNGTRNEPQPPTVIPAWTEVVPDILHEAWTEDVPDIQHDGWVEITPDIEHPAYVEVVPDIEHPEQVSLKSLPGNATQWDVTSKDICVYKRSLFGGPAINPAYKADCLTPREYGGQAQQGGGIKKIVIPGWVEEVPDIEHPEWIEDVPDIQHDGYVEVTPDNVHPAYTEIVPDIVHPEQVIENPDLVIPTKTIKYKDVTILPHPPFIDISFHYETTDGTCR